MKHEILEKIYNLLWKPSINESEVQHLMTLARKLIESQPKPDRQTYELLKFYCDWTAHLEIDRSKEGAQLIARAHTTVIDHLQKTDSRDYARDLTVALSLDRARDQFNTLLKRSGNGNGEVLIDEAKWSKITPILAEIISHCPVTVRNDRSKLARSIQRLRSRPIKGNSVVEQFMVAKLPSSTFKQDAPPDEITYCLVIVLSNTTRLITPMVKSR